MHWSDRWIGIPYLEGGRSPAGMDCLGLFLALQSVRCGRALFDPACGMAEAIRRRILDSQRPHWRRVKLAQEGDAVLLRASGRPLHVGFAIDDKHMLHVEGPPGSVIEPFAGHRWSAALEGIYRYAG